MVNIITNSRVKLSRSVVFGGGFFFVHSSCFDSNWIIMCLGIVCDCDVWTRSKNRVPNSQVSKISTRHKETYGSTMQSTTRGREPKTAPITDDYEISNTVLGLGINGKVVQCTNRSNGQKYALKVLHDNVKARREVDMHWQASGCRHIVNIVDVYENSYSGKSCLLVVMEWYVKCGLYLWNANFIENNYNVTNLRNRQSAKVVQYENTFFPCLIIFILIQIIAPAICI